jgi:hypothetical protein
MTKAQLCDQAIAEITIQKTRMTNAGNTFGANQLQAKIDALTFEKNR